MELLSYLLKVSACTVLFFGFYLLVLQKLTFFRINRFYLLITLLLSFIIPALQFNVERMAKLNQTVSPVTSEVQQYSPGQAQLIQVIQTPAANQEIDWVAIISCVYLGIGAILLSFSIWQLCRLIMHTRSYSRHENGLILVSKIEGFTNCSFFNYVFINENNLSEQDLAVLLKHEEVHAKQYHSIDKIILMICKAILWFNPVIYFFDKALEQTHEYEADEATSSNFGTDAYAKLLLKLAITKSEMPLIHNFVKSPIKNRIKMLFNSKSTKMKKLSYLFALPIAICMVWLFSIQIVYAMPKIKSVLSLQQIEKPTYKQVVKTAKGVMVNRNSNINAKTTLKFTDTIKLQSSLDPKIISSSKITGSIKTKISYLEDVVIEIRGTTIKAKLAEWNRNEKTLIASHVVITNGGSMVITEKAVFNLTDGTYRTYESNSEADKKISFIDFDLKENENMITKRIHYSADSVRTSKDKNTINIMGKAKMFFKDINMEADEIIYNNKTKIGSAKNMVITQVGSGTKIKGSNAKFNLNGKVEIWQNTDGNVIVEP